MSERICAHCGSDLYHAANAERVEEARGRWETKSREQAIEILRLQMLCAEADQERRLRGRKVERQRRTIVRLQKRLTSLGVAPHDDRGTDEGPIASSIQTMTLPSDEALLLSYPDTRGARKMKRRREALEEAGLPAGWPDAPKGWMWVQEIDGAGVVISWRLFPIPVVPSDG